MKLVLIHGRGQAGKDSKQLKADWEEALDKGFAAAGLTRPAGLEVAFPFYGDTLDDLIEQLDAPLVADVAERGATPDDDESTFRGEFLQELAEGAGVSQAEIEAEYQATRRARGEARVAERGPANWEWVHSIAKVLDRSRRLGEFAADLMTRDVAVYLTNKNVQRRINQLVAADVAGEPCVVVGHSLGSIVGYNMLLAHPSSVVRYVTVGSPLGIRAVKNRLIAPLMMPSKTKAWYNALDERDPVALYVLDGNNFGIDPAITNYTKVRNHTDNRHSIAGYLDDPWVARAIYEGLTSG